MSTSVEATCSAASLVAAEPLEATATEAVEWLLVEVRGAWGRDAVADTALPGGVREALDAFSGRVVLVRRPDRRAGATSGVTLLRASVAEAGGTIRRQELERLEAIPDLDLDAGQNVAGPVLLVCAHGRRDACCARLGPPLYDALAAHLEPDRLWQSSHLGGHRFAPNVVALPAGVQLGRIPAGRALEVLDALEAGRIPLDLHRGRTLYPPPVQAAEILVRRATGRDGIGDLRLLAHEGDRVVFATPDGERAARVEERPGPVLPVSCGAEPEPTSTWVARLEA